MERRVSLLSFGVLLSLLFGAGFAPPSERPSTSSGSDPIAWTIETVSRPKRLVAFGADRALRLDAAGHMHAVYGGDHLYYAYHDGVAWHITTVDNTKDSGWSASLALDQAGDPHISYFDYTNQALKYAHRSDGAWTLQTIAAPSGRESAIAVDAGGRPHVAFESGGLQYAVLEGATWQIQAVPNAESAQGWVAMALDHAGNPYITYTDPSDGSLRFVRRAGGAWSISIFDPTEVTGAASIAVDEQERPHISYVAGGTIAPVVKYAVWNGSGWDRQTVQAEAGWRTSLALDQSGAPHISYFSGLSVRYAHRDNLGWETCTLSSLAEAGQYTSLDVDSAGNVHVLFLTGDEVLKHAHWYGSNWSVDAVEMPEPVGMQSSLALDASGAPHISFSGAGLRYASRSAAGWSENLIDPFRDIGHRPVEVQTPGAYSSLALDAAGDPHIAHLDGNFLRALYATRSNGLWNTSEVGKGRLYGRTGLATDSVGLPSLSFVSPQGDLVYAQWTGTAWSFETVEHDMYEFEKVALALDAGGGPHLSYYDAYNHLKYATRSSGSWQVAIVDSAGSNRSATSLAVDSAGNPHIAYFDDGAELRYARLSGAAWITQTIGSGSLSASLKLDSAQRPHIAYYDGLRRLLKYTYWDGATWRIYEVANAINNWAPATTSLALDAAGNPHISYFDDISTYQGVLKLAVGDIGDPLPVALPRAYLPLVFR